MTGGPGMQHTTDSSMSASNLVDPVIDIVLRVARTRGISLERGDLSLESSLKDFDIDSMDQITIVSDIEDAFSADLPNEGLDQANCIGDLVGLLSATLADSKGRWISP